MTFGLQSARSTPSQIVRLRYAWLYGSSILAPMRVDRGGVHASLTDMQRFLAAHRDRTNFLSPASWNMLHEPADANGYAMGWFARADGKLEHGGWNRRWIALARVDRTTGTAAFTATNTGDQARGYPAVEQAIHLAAVEASKT